MPSGTNILLMPIAKSEKEEEEEEEEVVVVVEQKKIKHKTAKEKIIHQSTLTL